VTKQGEIGGFKVCRSADKCSELRHERAKKKSSSFLDSEDSAATYMELSIASDLTLDKRVWGEGKSGESVAWAASASLEILYTMRSRETKGGRGDLAVDLPLNKKGLHKGESITCWSGGSLPKRKNEESAATVPRRDAVCRPTKKPKEYNRVLSMPQEDRPHSLTDENRKEHRTKKFFTSRGKVCWRGPPRSHRQAHDVGELQEERDHINRMQHTGEINTSIGGGELKKKSAVGSQPVIWWKTPEIGDRTILRIFRIHHSSKEREAKGKKGGGMCHLARARKVLRGDRSSKNPWGRA